MAADDFCGGMNHNIGAVINRTEQQGGGYCVIHNQGNTVIMGDSGNGFKICNVICGISNGFHIKQPRVFVYGIQVICRVGRIYKPRFYA